MWTETSQWRTSRSHGIVLAFKTSGGAHLSEAQREPYRRAYEADKDEFDRALEVYKASGRLEAWKRDPHKPRRPLNAFAQFCKDLYAEDATHTFHDVLKRAPARWRALDEEQRGRYQREANLRNIKYMLQMEDYKLSGKDPGRSGPPH